MGTKSTSTSKNVRSDFVEVEGLNLHYLSAGEGEATLLLHGWPTSSHLWRHVVEALAPCSRVLAPDLPGFGRSDKPLDASYSFRYYDKAIDGFLSALNIDRVNLVVHDLGGPVGLMWALRHPEKLARLVLLNTLVYPEMSWAVKLFMLSLVAPGVRSLISSPAGIRWALRFGVHNKQKLTDDVLRPYWEPFEEKPARQALVKTALRLSPRGFREIEEKLPSLDVPVCLIYGENDRILPDVAKTMQRVRGDLPQAQLKALPNCGHFLQEDEPEKVADLLVEFLCPGDAKTGTLA